MDATLLKKIAEIKLYMIELNKENEVLRKEIDSIKSERPSDKKLRIGF